MTAVSSRRRALGIAAGLLVLPLLAACPGQSSTQPASEPDCDADDLLEGDEDCHGDSDSRRRTRKPAPRPASTRRR